MEGRLERPEQTLNAAFAAAEAGAWGDAMRLAGSVLAHDPLHTGAFEVISMARRALESARKGGAERRQMTIVFADVVGSTALLERLGGETYRDFMLELHQAAAKSVSRFGGRIAQYLGDGVLAYFSYPQAHEDDAQRAIYAALSLMDRLETATPTLIARFGQKPALRVGIVTGRVVVGAAGAGQWTTVDSVFGDAAHLAARLQALAPTNSILIAESTRQLVERHFVIEALGEKELAGFSQSVPVYRVVRTSDGPAPDAASPTMIDRDSEAAELEQSWAAVRAGERRELLIVGEAGVGKSRLVEHLSNVAIATGGRLVALHCSEAFQHSPFFPLSSALRRVLLGNSQSLPAVEVSLRTALVEAGIGEELLSRALVPVASLLDGGRPVDVLPQQLRATIIELVIELMTRLATGTPLLFVVEDLHRADASTAQLLTLIRQRCAAPMMIVATQRAMGPIPSDWQRSLQLNPLPHAFARSLVLRWAPHLDEAKVNDLINGSAGLPLFLIDAARGEASGTSLLSTTATSALLTHRLDQLDEDSGALVDDLSVLGLHSAYPLLAAISEVSTERLERALARLLHGGLLVACSTEDGSSFQFRHPLYQELAYDRQLLGARQRRHSRCADALIAADGESRTGPPPEIIGHHLMRSGRTAESVSWWQRAGDRAAASAANREAIAHYERAVESMSGLPATAEHAQLELVLRLSHGASCTAVYGYTDRRASQAYVRAAELAAAMSDQAVPQPALWGIWASAVVRGAHDEALELTVRCLALADAANSDDVRAVAGLISGCQYAYLGRWSEAEVELTLATKAAGPITQIFPHDTASASRCLLAVVHYVRGNELAAASEIEAALAGAASMSGRQAEFTRAYVFCYAAWFSQLRDDAATALSFAQQGLAIAQRNNFETWLGAGALHLAGALCELGDFDNGLPLFVQGLTGWRGAGCELFLPYFMGRYGLALTRFGQPEMALTVLKEALSFGEKNGELFYQAELHRLIAEALASIGAPAEDVTEQRRSAVRIATEQGAIAFRDRAQADVK